MKTDPALLKRIRHLYESGTSVSQITLEVGRSAASIYSLASAGQWKRPMGHGVKAVSVTEPKGEKLRGRVRCGECESMTEYDPCEHCGKAIVFK